MTKHELGPLPEGDRLKDLLKFRRLGFGAGHVLYECWDEAVRAYALAEVERAVMAERARCASLCEAEHVGRDPYDEELDDSDLAYNNAVRDCARAIRAQSAPKEQA